MDLVELAGKIELGTVQARDYAEWALSLLEEGSKLDSIAVLASMTLQREVTFWEVEPYFAKAIADLGIEIPKGTSAASLYSKAVCRDIVSGVLSPKDGLSKMEPLYRSTDYEHLYSIWSELSEDIWSLEHQDFCYFNSELTLERVDDYIVAVADQFIRLLDSPLPSNFFRLSWCKNCKNVGNAEPVRESLNWMPIGLYRVIFRRHPRWLPVCAKCRTPFPIGMGDFVARKAYLEQSS